MNESRAVILFRDGGYVDIDTFERYPREHQVELAHVIEPGPGLARLKNYLCDGFAGFRILHDTRVCGAIVPIWFPDAKVAVFVDQRPRLTLHDAALKAKGILLLRIRAADVLLESGTVVRKIEAVLLTRGRDGAE